MFHNEDRPAPAGVRKIPAMVEPEKLEQDLRGLVGRAIEKGASHAAVVDAKDIRFDPEIKAGTDRDDGFSSIHWPLEYPKDDILEAVAAYRKGVFLQILPDSHVPDYGGGPIFDAHHRNMYFRVSDIVSGIESAAFYLGYHLVIGLAAGNCRSIFCPDEKRCAAAIRGGRCIHPYRGRPSLSAVGINARALAEKSGFPVPDGKTTAILAGLVLVS